ncbi:MAG: response regulator [Rudaea sp.]
MTDPTTALTGQRILVMEDDEFGALALTALLQACGAETVGPIGWVQEALEFVNTQSATFDKALLDVNMHGEKSYPIADALIAHGKSFVFTTGYAGDALEHSYRHHPRCEKPFNRDTLLAVLLALP